MDASGDTDRALIPTGHDAASYMAVRSLAKRDVGSVVASEKADVPAAASRFCTESVDLPPPRDRLLTYRDALLELAAREAVTTVIPVRPEDCYVLSRYRDAFTDHVSLAVPTMRKLDRVFDRVKLARAAEAAGVPAPDTRPLSEVSAWDGDLVVKSRYNVLVDRYLEGRDEDSLDIVKDIFYVDEDSTESAAEIRRAMGHDPVVQEYVPKEGEFVVGALYDHGEPLLMFQHEQIRGESYTGGGGVYRESMYDPELQAVAHDLLAELDWHGLACIEYMRDSRTGEYVLTEINPRLWQSLPVAMRARADFPYAYWLQVTGRANEIRTDYDLGVGSHLLHGEVGYLVSVLTESSPHVDRPSVQRAIWDVCRSCVSDPHFDYLSPTDVGPFLAGVRRKLPL